MLALSIALLTCTKMAREIGRARPLSVNAFLIRSGAMMLALAGFVALASNAQAQDLEPRAYANTPVGLNFVVVGYAYQEGDVATDASLPLEDGEVQVDSLTFAYVRSLGLWGKSAKIEVVVPYASASGSATLAGMFHERDVSGWGDTRFRFSVNFSGAPGALA